MALEMAEDDEVAPAGEMEEEMVAEEPTEADAGQMGRCPCREQPAAFERLATNESLAHSARRVGPFILSPVGPTPPHGW